MEELPYLLVRTDEKEACRGNLSLRMKVKTIEVIANQFMLSEESAESSCVFHLSHYS